MVLRQRQTRLGQEAGTGLPRPVCRLVDHAKHAPRHGDVRLTGFDRLQPGLPVLPVPAKAANMGAMKSITALEAKNRFGEVLEAAQRQPVSITRNGRPSVVVISAESYARRQRMARERLRQSLQRAGDHAASQGMSEDVLGQLLADES